jgi:hypothetical protein
MFLIKTFCNFESLSICGSDLNMEDLEMYEKREFEGSLGVQGHII